MRGKVSIIKKIFIIHLFVAFLLTLYAKPYKPYPILFVHGVNSGSGTWGAEVENREVSDSIPQSKLEDNSTYTHFLYYMTPCAIAWHEYEEDYLEIPPTYTIPGEDAYPNKTFLEVINFDEIYYNGEKKASASLDPDLNNKNPNWRYRGEGQELYERVVEIMEEYYGKGWDDSSNTKLIFVAHSGGGMAVRECIYEYPYLKPHIYQVITLGTPHNGCKGEELVFLIDVLKWIETFEWIISPILGSAWFFAYRGFMTQVNFGLSSFGYDCGVYAPMGDDCAYGSDFLQKINDPANFQGDGFSWHCLVGTGGYGADVIGSKIMMVGGACIAAGCFFNPWLIWIGIELTVKGGWVWWMGANTDGLMSYRDADINYSDPRYNAEVKKIYPLSHTDEPKRWGTIRNFIEYPPRFYWDTLFASKYVIDSITQDTIFMDTVIDLRNEDPELGTYKPDSISGKLYAFFLAQCKIDLHLNIINWEPLTWENGDFGRNGNRFVIKNLMERGVFPGWNRLKATAVNVINQKANDQIRFFYNPFLTYLEFKAPLDEDCFQSSTDTSAVVYFSDNRSPLQAESLSVIFEDNVILETTIIYPEEDSIYHDTLRVPFSPISPMEEGAYLIKAVVKNKSKGSKPAKSIISIYIDDTPPEPLITFPLEEDSVVHSSRVEDWMPFVFMISDNFDTLIITPKNEEAFIEITDSLDNLVWTDTIGNDATVAGCYYNIPKTIYWNFKDSDSNKVTYSGKYNVILSCLDKAGNLGSDTSFFIIDNEPPLVTVISPFDSLLTSNKDFVELEYTINENAEIKLTWKNENGEESTVRDGYAYPDTNYFFEGADMYGNYLVDGLYTPRFNAKDNAGNDTTYTEGIVEGGTLRADRTPPSIYDLATPWIVGPNDTVNVYFKISEDLDKLVNMGKVIVKVYIDENMVDSLIRDPKKSKIEIEKNYDISGYKNGTHRITVTVEDKWGNANTRMTEIVKGTIGTKITKPLEGDTLGQGWIMIKGLVNDPDMYNTIPFGGFGTYYKQLSSSKWDSTRIIVPEVLRIPGIPQNRGIKPVTNVSDIARWNTQGFTGLYELLLTSREEGDGGLVLADTVNVFIESTLITSPSISDFVVNIQGGDTDTIFEPANGEKVSAGYVLHNKPADISFDFLNRSGRNMAHLEQKGVMAVSSSLPVMDREGIYLDFYNNKWWVRWRFENLGLLSGQILSLDNKSFSITDTLDTLIFVRSTQEGKIEFNCANISGGVYEGGFGFTGEGRIQFDLSFNEGKNVWVAGSKLNSPFVLGLASPFSYNGIVFGEGHIPGGRYTVRVSANGIDGMGYDEKSDEISAETDLVIKDSLVSDKAYPLDTLPATVEYLVNLKSRVKIDVYKGSNFLLNIEDIDSVAGGRWLLASWNGIVNDIPAEYGNNYKFKITAYTLPDYNDSLSVFSDNFSVMDSILSTPGNFFIPPYYFVGKIHNDSVFNGKTDFSWEASAEGELYRPMIYKFADTAKGIRKIAIDWKVEVDAWVLWGENGEGIVDSAVDYYGSSSGSWADTNFFYLDYVNPIDNPRASYYQVKYEYCAEGGWVALDTNELVPWDLCSESPIFCVEGGSAIEERWLHLDKKIPKVERLCIGALTWSTNPQVRPRIYATHNFPYPVDTIVTGIYTISGNVGIEDKDEIIGFQFDITPPDEFFHNDEPGGRSYTYTLTTTIDGSTQNTSLEDVASPSGVLDLCNNNVCVQLDFQNNKIYAWIADTSQSSTKWKKVAIRTDTCYPVEGGGSYHTDTTKMSDLFIIPADVDPTTVIYSDPIQIWEKKYVSLTKSITNKGDSCIVATVKDWDPSWTSIRDDGCLYSYGGKLKGEGPFFVTPSFDFDGVSEKKDTFSSAPYQCQGTATNYTGTFWWHGGDSVTSNLYLNITDWNVNLFYPNGDINKDLFVEIDSLPSGVTPPKELIATYGYGKGARDYFRPFHFMKPEIVPRNYVEIDGHSEGNYYRMYEFDGKYMKEITNNIMNPVSSSSIKPLAYWNVTNVCGKRRVIMELYNSPGASPGALRYRDFYIGNPYRPGKKDIAHSPFYRANLFFDVGGASSFDDDTLTSVSPVAITDMIEELSYEAPLLGEYKGPIVLLQPKGAKFEPGRIPTFEYYYTETEAKRKYGLNPGNVSLYAIKDDGFLDDITSSAFWTNRGGDSVLTLKASPDKFPPDGDFPFFVSLLHSQTVKYKPTVTSVSSTNIDSAKVTVENKLKNLNLLLIRCGEEGILQSSTFKTSAAPSISSPPEKKTLNIYSAIEAFKNQTGGSGNGKNLTMSSSRWDITKVDTMSVNTGSTGTWQGYIHLESGNNYIFVGDKEALLFALEVEEGDIRNCPVGFTKITLDKTGPEIVFTRDPDPIISYPGDMESIAFYPTENAFIHYVKFKPTGEIADVQTFYSLAYDITEIYWDGKDEYGRLCEEGTYPYVLFAIDDFGNRSREEKHRWEIRWGIPVDIVSPRSGMWLKGTQTLRSRIEGDFDYPVDWYKKWDETWGYLGTEEHPGDGLLWNTTFLPDEKNVWLKASVEDIFGHTGADSVRVKGIDNNPPEIYIWIGEPIYQNEFISGITPIFATAVDTFSAVYFLRYRIDGGSLTNLRDTFNLSGYPNGRHQIDFSTRDYANNDTTYSLSVYLDKTPPFSHLVFGEPKKIYNDTLYISPETPINVEAFDTCGIAHSYYKVTSINKDLILDWTEVLGTFNIPYTSSYYKYIIFYYSVDNLGNTELPQDTVVGVDCEPPVTTLHIGSPSYPVSDPLYITSHTPLSFTSTDDISGVDTTYYRIDDNAWNVYSGVEFNVTNEGNHTVEYYSVDKAGNKENVKSKELIVDNTPPLTTLQVGSPSYEPPTDSSAVYITSNTLLSLKINDEGCGVDSTYYRINSDIWDVYSGEEFNLANEGIHIIEYYSVDNLGNREDVNSKELRVDDTHPISQLATGDPNYVLAGDSLQRTLITSETPLILTAEDPISNGVASGVKELEYEITSLPLSGSPISATADGDSTVFTITGEDGSYKVDYRARDNVLNEEPFNSKYYKLDNTPPVAIILSPLDSTMVSDEITIIGTAKDEHFKEYVLDYGVGIDPGDWNIIKVSDKEVEDSVLGKLNVSCITGNIITVRLRATDLVGNEGMDEVVLWKGGLICEFDIPLHKPEGVDFDDEGNIYATDRKGGKKERCADRDKVKKFDPFGNLIYEITDRYVPNDVAVTPWNSILISEQVRKEITEFNQSQEYLRSIKNLKCPDGVDVTRLPDSGMRCKDKDKGELKDIVIGVADQTANKVILYDSLFRKIKEINVTDKKLLCYHHPEGISFDKEANVYTCLINNNVVRKYDLDGNILMEIRGFNKPSDVEVDYRGYIWVTDRNNDRIRCFDSYGNHLFKYGKKGKGCGEFNKPEGIAVNHERLYVADMNNDRVQVLRFPFSVRFPTLSSIGKTRQEALSIQECVPYPNPCDPAKEFSNIRVVVNRDCEIEVRIYTITGTLLWETSITGFEGINEVNWNGMNSDGEEVRNGVYNVLVRASDGSEKDEERTKIIVYRR
jgi:hypothetical protein